MKKKSVHKVAFIILLLIIMVCIIIFMIGRIQKKQLLNKAEEKSAITIDDKEYQLKDNVVNLLILGIDKEEVMTERDDDGGSVGQADAIFLLSLDLDNHVMEVVAIPRDTMVYMQMYDENDNYIGNMQGQIALQYAFADGQEKSCELLEQKVTSILYGIPINGYAAVNVSAIPVINDAVGGVEVTMDDDYTYCDPEFEKGKTIRLLGEQATEFVQTRDILEYGSAYKRIGRQKLYLQSFINQTRAAVKDDPSITLTLLDELTDNMYTDLDNAEIVYLVSEAIKCQYDEDKLWILPGDIQMGDRYEEYYLREEEMKQGIVERFCKTEEKL